METDIGVGVDGDIRQTDLGGGGKEWVETEADR